MTPSHKRTVPSEEADAPESLHALPLPQLAEAEQRLRRTGHLDRILEVAEVEATWLDSAIRFLVASPGERASSLARRLAAEIEGPLDDEDRRWSLRLGPAFPLNLEKLELLLPSAETPIDDVLTRMRNQPGRDAAALVVGQDARQQQTLHRALAVDRSNQWAAPSPSQLTALLLAGDPSRELAKILASQVNRIRLSPYQTGQGVRRGELFFGREGLLAHVLDRAPASYLLVGGRQLGKSSLLRAIERRLQDDPQVDCHYFVLETGSYDDDQLAQRLAACLDLPDDAPLETAFDELAKPAAGDRRRLVLIDEADALVRAERERGYPIFGRFRSLAQEDRCHVILAGFWELYAAAVLDYQAPIKNFGEILRVGALEEGACRQLATRPMETLGLAWTGDDALERLIHATGRRANLVAIACNEILKTLTAEDRVIAAEAVDQALDSRAVANAVFGGWETLAGPDDLEGSFLDRLSVYATVERDSFTQAEILRTLADRGYRVSPERLRRTLERLELACVLRRQGESYSYCVPLFVDRLRAQEPELLFENELQAGVPASD